jgi:CO dehydrogenase maturation factor
VHTYLDQQKKNWNKLYVQACEFHLKNAESWGNAATGKNLSEQIDPDFMLNP